MCIEIADSKLTKESFYTRHKTEIDGAVGGLALVGLLGVGLAIQEVSLHGAPAFVQNTVDYVVDNVKEQVTIPGPADFDTMLTSITVPTPYEA